MKKLGKLAASIREQYEKNPNKANLNYARRRSEAYLQYRLQEAARRAGRARKQRPWAVALAAHLAARFPSSKFPELWKKIPSHESDDWTYDGFDVYRDGDYLTAINAAGSSESITRETFRTEYVTPARHSNKHRQGDNERDAATD